MAIDKDSNSTSPTGSSMSSALGTDVKPDDDEESLAGATLGSPSTPATIGPSSPSPQVTTMPKQQKAGTGTFANLKSYLQAAQGGGRVAQAATQRVQNVGAGAQKGLQQATEAFGSRLGAGSGVIFQGAQPDQYLTPEQAAEQAKARTASIIGTARNVTYQAPAQPTPVVPEQPYTPIDSNPFKAQLGDRYNDFQKELDTIESVKLSKIPDDQRTEAIRQRARDLDALYARYGVKLPEIVLHSNSSENIPTTTAPADSSNLQQPLAQQQYFTPEQTQSFADIINARYEGPASLQQAGLYESAAQKARVAQEAATKTQTAGGREALLRDIFSRGRDYSRGASKLDALLLNTSQQGVQQLQQQAQPALQAQQLLQEASNLSANQAAQRAAAIQGIATGARGEFTEARTAEELIAEEGIDYIQQNWNKLPDYLKTSLMQAVATPQTSRVGDLSITDKRYPDYANDLYDALLGKQRTNDWWKGWQDRPFQTYNLSPEESALLGTASGSPMFFDASDISAAPMAAREELITKDQLARQLALQQLSQLDKSKGLQKDLVYSDLEKAGSKDILSSLDLEKVQRTSQERQKQFEQELARQNRSIGTPSGYKTFDYLERLGDVGYQRSDMGGLLPEGYGRGVLEQIAKDELPSRDVGMQSDYVQKMWEKDAMNVNFNQLASNLQNLQDILKKYKGTTSQVVDNEATRARTEGLRKLLSEISNKP
jgi:hypothetical protein